MNDSGVAKERDLDTLKLNFLENWCERKQIPKPLLYEKCNCQFSSLHGMVGQFQVSRQRKNTLILICLDGKHFLLQAFKLQGFSIVQNTWNH